MESNNEEEQFNYTKERTAAVCQLEKNEAYPHKFEVSETIEQYRAKYDNLEAGERLDDTIVRLAGRIMRVAGSSSKLRFYDLVSDDFKVQIFANAQVYDGGEEEFLKIVNYIHRGDIVGVIGTAGKTKRNELSVFATKLIVLAPCLRMLPTTIYGLKDQEIRYRQRYIDLIMNPSVIKTFKFRAQIINFIRNYLNKLDFVEVETPMMNSIPGGANARPFETYHNDLDTKVYLRISPELYLKRLVVGGMNRVFEIGKNFRNEGIDLTHNPEFTAVEFYMAYADIDDITQITEDMVSSLVKKLTGSYKVEYSPDGDDSKKRIIDFTPPWPRYSFVDEIEKEAKQKIPRPLDSPEAVEVMKKMCKDANVDWPSPLTASKLINKLCEVYVEGKCENPAFICDHPKFMSPLAKWNRHNPEYAERCELFVCGRELANFYTELNDPLSQRQAFHAQAKDKAAGDDEAQFFDEDYCVALEYGLPPTGGWGLGIDRLVMFLTNNYNIKEVLLFPAMRPIKSGSAHNQKERTENEKQ